LMSSFRPKRIAPKRKKKNAQTQGALPPCTDRGHG
jgi:hypothetical protein